jgi:hypothetical protein
MCVCSRHLSENNNYFIEIYAVIISDKDKFTFCCSEVKINLISCRFSRHFSRFQLIDSFTAVRSVGCAKFSRQTMEEKMSERGREKSFFLPILKT